MSVRYQVINKGALWHIIDRSTGKTVGFAATHRKAVQKAVDMEFDILIQLEQCRAA